MMASTTVSEIDAHATQLTAKQIVEAFKQGEHVEVPAHPAADIFPRMPKKDLSELAADIKERGLQEPIFLHPNGTILDGINRLRACRIAGCEPKFQIWKGREGEEFSFIIGRNLRRRHLTDNQRCMVAAKLAKLKPGKRISADLPTMKQPEAAAAFAVSERGIRQARRVIDQAPPNVAALVEQAKLPLTVAEAVAKASVEDRERIASLGDDEALVAARGLAKKGESNQTRSAALLIQNLKALLAHWADTTDEARAELLQWLSEEVNAPALEALRTIAAPAPGLPLLDQGH